MSHLGLRAGPGQAQLGQVGTVWPGGANIFQTNSCHVIVTVVMLEQHHYDGPAAGNHTARATVAGRWSVGTSGSVTPLPADPAVAFGIVLIPAQL